MNELMSTCEVSHKAILRSNATANRIRPISILLACCAFGTLQLGACGGGGSGAVPPVPTPPVSLPPAAVLELNPVSVKTFRFGWQDVRDATHYRLLENADSGSGFIQVGGDISPGVQTVDHTVPLYARLNAQYILQSCNAAGCTDSASVSAGRSLVTAIGYVKASNTDAGDQFGFAVSLSADGTTLAVGALREDSNTIGIGGNQSDNSATDAGAVYVFTRNGSTWSQQAYIKGSNTEPVDQFGRAVSLSADGNTLAVGAFLEDSSAIGIDGNQSDNTADGAGAVYVFSRSGGTWSQQAYVKASNTDPRDQFGRAVNLSGDGNTLAVGALAEASNTTGIDGNQADNTEFFAGAVYVFSRSGVTWSQQAYIKASNAEGDDEFGGDVSLSADGNRLAVGAALEASNATGIDGNQADNTASGAGAVYMFIRNGAAWRQQAYVKASNTEADDLFGFSVSLSADGNTLAGGALREDSSATGIDLNPGDNSAPNAGAVYVFAHNGSTWSQQAYIKASNTGTGDRFGRSVSLDADGSTLAVSATLEGSNATGINGNQSDNSESDAGAVYLFIRNGGAWRQQAYVKASNTEDDIFGAALDLSADGNSLAVGALREDGNATGIDGDASDNSAVDAGAVYLY